MSTKKELFDEVSMKHSKILTHAYSTSFSLGIRMLHKSIQDAIYAIYGYVRVADEIVDSFHDFDKKTLLAEFRQDTYKALKVGVSTNPILNSFQAVVKKYDINIELIDTFLDSMEMDLNFEKYSKEKYDQYILGSAEVVGLMCLKVFCLGKADLYSKLKPYAMKLGSAFQKINFLRDMQNDYEELGRMYFPGVDFNAFSYESKKEIEEDIAKDFALGLQGIKMLPLESRFGVYLAYIYYLKLFNKIKTVKPENILKARIRIPNTKKVRILFGSYLRHSVNLL
ncbi:MAG: phytoene/squalene synthase family protein [Flavobacteriales bacterium]|nr:phytoene/squalene synthase family protein [Flavobacteriales bacterium]